LKFLISYIGSKFFLLNPNTTGRLSMTYQTFIDSIYPITTNGWAILSNGRGTLT